MHLTAHPTINEGFIQSDEITKVIEDQIQHIFYADGYYDILASHYENEDDDPRSNWTGTTIHVNDIINQYELEKEHPSIFEKYCSFFTPAPVEAYIGGRWEIEALAINLRERREGTNIFPEAHNWLRNEFKRQFLWGKQIETATHIQRFNDIVPEFMRYVDRLIVIEVAKEEDSRVNYSAIAPHSTNRKSQ